ncbi:glycoside hydrolase family 3 C-terminal domain-containing protein [Mediterraneibacter glycyrrhizinilyticus]|uniref:glycoside hydrolase family 3 C-terminal domain-containing protein n=1 Tax=Mediterraneibacter glycyrrhizinilyticus TaxID=342942 RepID=UPI001960AFF2|nr:glycoside hydrolase family 3 C-terminal domain-containing protein [Mediterraneibacter glycyrrhizinilyticus]MBM6854615.1 glycoside hydrolase family 3 C-terminal domain-containing protein [Mediterraneibacter glycyrrhizinilyticus]MDM8211809.1 glycoside hydrolase family 3 C-terminal domain-containing protein [Mediterraneibacter glycyrrhizinilyticus]
MDRKEARRKAQELVMKMTIEEKASQLRYDSPGISRLGIPEYNWWNEGLHGVARAGIATVFPQAIGMAASFDEDMVRKIGDIIAEEGRAKYNAASKQDDRDIYKGLTFWAPNVNIFRDPRWGRGHETYGEDPCLTATLGKAYVEGLQGNGETMKAAACAKHFAVHSGPEALRHEFNAEVSQKDMEETYLPAFKALVEDAHVEAVMGAYNCVNGEPCCGSKTLIKNKLRGEWNFEGHFVSDCWAIRDFHENHMVTGTPMQSAAMALNAGCDLNCGNTYLHILNAYHHGMVTEEAITEAAVRLFTTRFMLGLFDGSEYDKIPYSKVECSEHLLIAHKAALESIVLLKNENGILPLKENEIKTLGIIGPNADSRAALIGNYHGTSSEYVTVLEGVRRYVGDEIRIIYSQGCDLFKNKTEPLAQDMDRLSEAVTVAQNSDVIILCLGLDETLEGEEGDTGNSYASGDKEDLQLPLCQRRLMEVVAQTGKPVILCMMAGSDIDLSFAQKHFEGILQLWYPGARGGNAVAEILFGKESPSGKLPVTFYETLSELPSFEDYSMSGRTYRYMKGKAQYPFGYGLTYGKAEVRSVEVVETETGANVFVKVENTGERDICEVLQIYIKCENSIYAVPNPQLCGFCRVKLYKEERKTLQVHIPGEAFTVVDEEGRHIAGGKHYTIYAGFSQPDAKSEELMGMSPVKVEFRKR